MATYLSGKRLTLNPAKLIGKGGEADIYQIDPDRVLKLYKRTDDIDYVGNPEAQQGATLRLKEHQHKLPDFPKGLPLEVVYPRELAYDTASGGEIVGYSMEYLHGLEVLLRLGDKQYREQGGIDGNDVVNTFKHLHSTVTLTHKAGVVIGDFNDLNIMVDHGRQLCFLVDADSMQFGPYFCRTFTSRFLDPLLSDRQRLLLINPHNQNSDWYAYNTMLFQSLLYVGPYGGVHKPPHGKRLQHDARVLQRLTVFDPYVIYPKPALPLDRLPDELLQHFQQVYERDDRGEFPLRLLQSMRWTSCNNCGTQHARPRCPACAAPGAVKETTVIRGRVTATTEFKTRGQILHAVVQDNKLRYLYHDQDMFLREGGDQILSGTLHPKLRFRIQKDTTLIGQGPDIAVLSRRHPPKKIAAGTVNDLTMFDANDDNYFWIAGDQLLRTGRVGPQYMGNILPNRTLFWVGKKFGFGFYQAGNLRRMFVFDVERSGIGEMPSPPPIVGQLVDATCVSSDTYIWFMLTTQEHGHLLNHCHVIDHNGMVVASETADPLTDQSWLTGGIRGHFATGKSLFATTDEGIVRVEVNPGTIQVAERFPDTEPFVDSTGQLLPGPGGIYAVSPHEITLLRIS